jgi:hypothetical protein
MGRKAIEVKSVSPSHAWAVYAPWLFSARQSPLVQLTTAQGTSVHPRRSQCFFSFAYLPDMPSPSHNRSVSDGPNPHLYSHRTTQKHTENVLVLAL